MRKFSKPPYIFVVRNITEQLYFSNKKQHVVPTTTERKTTPDGWDLIEDTIEDFEAQMRDAVSEEHEGKRKNELTWRIHQNSLGERIVLYSI